MNPVILYATAALGWGWLFYLKTSLKPGEAVWRPCASMIIGTLIGGGSTMFLADTTYHLPLFPIYALVWLLFPIPINIFTLYKRWKRSPKNYDPA